MARRRSAQEIMAEALARAEANGPPQPKPGSNGKEDVEEGPPPGLRVATIADLKKAGAEVEWLWKGWLATKVVCAMAAEAGLGKTRFVCDIARRIKFRLPWPDGQPMTLPADSKVMFVAADNHHDQLVTIAERWDIEDTVVFNAWSGEPFDGTSLENDDDYKHLDYRVQFAKPLIVVIDTVGNATDRSMSRQEDARAFYMPLQVLARKRKCCVFALTHLNATGQILGRRAKEKVRVVIDLAKPDPKDDRLSLAVTKSFDKKPDPLGVTLEDGGYAYDKEPPKVPEYLEPGMQGAGQQGPAKRGAGRPAVGQDRAIAWLSARLADGQPARVVDLRREWEAEGISVDAAYGACREIAMQEGEPRRLTWRLREPPQAQPSTAENDDSDVFPN